MGWMDGIPVDEPQQPKWKSAPVVEPPVIATTADGGRIMRMPDGSLSFASPGMSTNNQDTIKKLMEGATPVEASTYGNVSEGGQLGTAIRSGLQGMTFGFGDELVAKGASMLGGTPYEAELDRERARLDKGRANNPVTATASEITGAVAVPVGAVGSTGKLGVDMLKGAATGAGLSGVYGFGAGEGGFQNRAQDAALSAAAGGLIGGVIPVAGAGINKIATALAERGLAKEALKVAPTTEQLRAAGNAAYKAVDDAGVVVKPEALGGMVEDVTGAMRRSGLDEGMGSLTPQSERLAAILEDAATNPKNAGGIPFSEVDLLRRKSGVPASNMANPTESKLGMQAIEGVDNFVNNITPDQVLSGDAAALPGLINKARETWATMSKSQLIDDAITASENYLSGGASGIRNQFARILKSDKLSRGFSETEKRAMRKVINGSIPEQLLNLVSGGLGQLGLMGGGAAAGGATGAIAGAAIAGGARRGAEAVAQRNAEIVRALVASGKGAQVPQIGGQMRGLIEALMQRGTAAGLQQ
jgi:hypothetical protein